jgi:hypothetical protein
MADIGHAAVVQLQDGGGVIPRVRRRHARQDHGTVIVPAHRTSRRLRSAAVLDVDERYEAQVLLVQKT